MVAAFLVALAGLARERGQLRAAEERCRQALALLEPGGERLQLERAEALNGLGLALHELGEREAETVLRQALELRRQRLEDDDQLVRLSRNNLARTLAAMARLASGSENLEAFLATRGTSVGIDVFCRTPPTCPRQVGFGAALP